MNGTCDLYPYSVSLSTRLQEPTFRDSGRVRLIFLNNGSSSVQIGPFSASDRHSDRIRFSPIDVSKRIAVKLYPILEGSLLGIASSKFSVDRDQTGPNFTRNYRGLKNFYYQRESRQN